MAPLLQDPCADIELNSPPLAQPLRKPSFVPPVEDGGECTSSVSSTLDLYRHRTKTVRRKHQSYNLSGSIFLVTSSGMMLKLPVPSESPADPLNWSRWKTAGAITAVAWYSIVSLTVVQAASMVYNGILTEFNEEVCAI